ncbi:MAG: hypothetical protein KDI83_10635 [Gammaproteobacteria bacterium]|nr:hypothetical protein [Gammaproteobacteria bacterium]
MTKINILAAAIAVASVSSLAAAAPPPGAPSVYNNGPFTPAMNVTNLSEQERVAYALLEGIMQSAEAKIHAHGCQAVTLPLSVYVDAVGTTPTATLGAQANDRLILSLKTVVDGGFRGKTYNLGQDVAGFINGTPVFGYLGTMIYNSANNMMLGNMEVNVLSSNWVPNKFTGHVVKDFYMGSAVGSEGAGAGGGDDQGRVEGTDEQHLVFDWGLQSLLKESYPVEKYWQRSKSRRSDGGNGQTAFVKDRLVGVTPCRIAIALSGLNQVDIFWQTGSLTISTLKPAEVTPGQPGVPAEISSIVGF